MNFSLYNLTRIIYFYNLLSLQLQKYSTSKTSCLYHKNLTEILSWSLRNTLQDLESPLIPTNKNGD